ncbi:ABC transporter permease [Microterricola pindariensis]|uniref:Peptide ABC transporter permease n=1 Tax=Microterricola pindariensis TaxID=478010 RepID=A0ABX5B0W3_9MICO|nr:ABC transporter permease [Microterricola pindariensis]PPL20229.1 peptide ABC transporter permease [Microterricola pindariensis]
MGILIFALRRFLLAIPTLLGLLIVTFILANFMPGDPLARLLGDVGGSNPETVAAYRAQWGLDRPLWEQFFIYVGNLLQGDLGQSTFTRRGVMEDLLSFLPATVELGVAAILFAGIIGLALGSLAALFHNKWPDFLVRAIALLASGVPVFWLGLIALQVFYLQLGWSPGPEGRLSSRVNPPPRITGAYTVDSILSADSVAFWDSLAHIVLPAAVLGAFFLGLVSRMMRASMLDVLKAPYLMTARSKGLNTRTIAQFHVLPNALIPTITVVGLAIGGLLAGAVLTETVFSWPGIGRYAVDAAKALDYQAILGVTLLIGFVYVITNAIIDVVYAALDPRIRLGS